MKKEKKPGKKGGKKKRGKRSFTHKNHFVKDTSPQSFDNCHMCLKPPN